MLHFLGKWPLNHKVGFIYDTLYTFVNYVLFYICTDCKAYALESINILRKYSAMMDIPISYLLSSYWYILSLRERKILKVRHKDVDVHGTVHR